jgi:hypothetical protein
MNNSISPSKQLLPHDVKVQIFKSLCVAAIFATGHLLGHPKRLSLITPVGWSFIVACNAFNVAVLVFDKHPI